MPAGSTSGSSLSISAIRCKALWGKSQPGTKTARHEDGPARVRAWLALRNVFGQDLPENPTFVAAVTEAYRSLMQHSALATVAGLLND